MQEEEPLATGKEKWWWRRLPWEDCYLSSWGTASSRPLQRKGSRPYSPSCFKASANARHWPNPTSRQRIREPWRSRLVHRTQSIREGLRVDMYLMGKGDKRRITCSRSQWEPVGFCLQDQRGWWCPSLRWERRNSRCLGRRFAMWGRHDEIFFPHSSCFSLEVLYPPPPFIILNCLGRFYQPGWQMKQSSSRRYIYNDLCVGRL